jgi:hypothetical protein
MVYRFRVLLDTDEEADVFRDIEMLKEHTLEDFHNTITQAFGFDGTEMASFYVSDEEWNQGEEISLFDMSDSAKAGRLMGETMLEEVVSANKTKLIYLYDFLNMWTFLVELAEIVEAVEGNDYPNLMFVHGQIPEQVPEKQFEAETDDFESEFEDDLDASDYDDLDFDENWN